MYSGTEYPTNVHVYISNHVTGISPDWLAVCITSSRVVVYVLTARVKLMCSTWLCDVKIAL